MTDTIGSPARRNTTTNPTGLDPTKATGSDLQLQPEIELPTVAAVPVEMSPDELKFLYGAAATSGRTDLAYRLASVTALLDLNLKRERNRAKRTSANGRS